LCLNIVSCDCVNVASKPRPSGWLWVETQQTSEGGTSSSSERLAGTSSPGSSDDLQHDRGEQSVHRVSPRSPERLPTTHDDLATAPPPITECRQTRFPHVDDEAVYRSTLSAELTPSPRPQAHRVLTPPVTRTGDMPFISDRTFPIPDSGPQTQSPTRDPASSPAGYPRTGPRSPGGTSKPLPPPRTVSMKSPEVVKSSQASDVYAVMKSYSPSSSSESSRFSYSERCFDATGSYEYAEKFESSKNHREFEQDHSASQTSSYSPRQAPGTQCHDPSTKNRSNFEGCLSDDGQSTAVAGTVPAAVDMLFSYHQMTQQRAGDGQFSTSPSFNSRCSPAVMTQTQPASSTSSRVAATHYYV